MVFNDAVVHQRHPARPGIGFSARAMAEMRVRVVHRRRAVRGPARVRNAGAAFNVLSADLRLQLGHARGASRALQATGIHRHAAGVITPVFEPLQALHEDGNDVAVGNRGDDATHKPAPKFRSNQIKKPMVRL